MRVGFKRDIEESDLWPLDPYLESDSHVPEFNRLWKEEVDRTKVEQPETVEYSKISNRIRSRSSKAERQPLLGMDHNSRISDFNEVSALPRRIM
ncbi:hypothetical protein ElyMa_003792300 [Elysia marginata]|uniref:Uncharacterized protein n=1 Tax=Elysia marginata TaxID=1093978 RepID=A0AAV4FCU8_9GAST|nr:hypothetical protein ElyMa_003792300 [Elysia marginata]